MNDIVTRLRDWAYTICTVNSHVPPSSKAQMARDAAAEIERLRADLVAMRQQRDEARRLWCIAVEEIESGMTNETRYEVAESKGWDCFAQQEGGGA